MGSVLGLAVFFVGVGLLLFTFKQAFDLFSVDPKEALNLKDANTLELGTVGSTLTGLVKQILLLIVMALTGSLIGSKGVAMYTESRAYTGSKEEVVEVTTQREAST